MQPETKKLGEVLVEAELITAAQLQEAIRHQRIAGGRMGSNLVALGFISEDALMDFLAQKTGVPRVDVRNLDIPPEVLQRIPKRLADQLNVLPISIKEPKSLVLAMTDPMDLNAVDSARFSSGLNIEPVVASYSALKLAIAEQYRKVAGSNPKTVNIGPPHTLDQGLPVNFEPQRTPLDIKSSHPPTSPTEYGHDPFFDALPVPQDPNPFSFFTGETGTDVISSDAPTMPGMAAPGLPLIVHARSSGAPAPRRLDLYLTRTILMSLVKLLQRRGVMGEDELQRFTAELIESGEIKDAERQD